jgi:hypothetical protein
MQKGLAMKRAPARDNWGPVEAERSVRVLLECGPEETPSIMADILRKEGYEVVVCTGPDLKHSCAQLGSGTCGAVSETDVVVNLLGFRDDEASSVLTAISDQRRPPAIVTAMTPLEVERRVADDDWPFDPRQMTVIARPLTTKGLIDGVSEALRRHGEHRPTWGE